jgi:transketolase
MNAPDTAITGKPADALRFLAADAVQLANSGHPGAPLGMADMAAVLWRRHLRHNPLDPHWRNRDRFVLSNGHASMLLYALLHLTGYDVTSADLRQFRQLHARTPGHPEHGLTPGVETTTGPLGQGLANAVGMALAEQRLAATFNRPGHAIVDHRTWCFAGDGCLMEGISHEACSLAGTLQLAKLTVLYDDNGISIDGDVKGWFTDDTPARFRAYGWHVVEGVDGHDDDAIDRAIVEATSQSARPTLICCKTNIGHGAPNKAGGHDVHGSPLGAVEIAAMRAARNWDAAAFDVPARVAASWDARAAGSASQAAWDAQFAAYRTAFPDLAAELERRSAGTLPDGVFPLPATDMGRVATRKASQMVLEQISARLPELFGGSADLTASNLTYVKSSSHYLSYGVREFGMAAIMNGVALHGGFIPFGGTFLTFSDYSRNAIRMAALMRQRVIHVLTHDSIGLGEDGPTHQPVEHIASLRIIPNNRVWRPCDGAETAAAWQAAVQRSDGPTCLILSRQALAAMARTEEQTGNIARGGYVLLACEQPQVVLLATGSEVEIAMAAASLLAGDGIAAQVVSLPCLELFDAQDTAYRAQVLPRGVPRVSVEAGVTWFWRALVGEHGATIGIDGFGASAPAEQLYAHFGITSAHVAARALALVRGA